MGAALRWPPSPPPPFERTSKPGMRKCSRERTEKKLYITEQFNAWCEKHHISVSDLAAIADLGSTATVQSKLTGEHDVAIVDLLGLDDRRFNELLFAMREWRSAFLSGARAKSTITHK